MPTTSVASETQSARHAPLACKGPMEGGAAAIDMTIFAICGRSVQ